MTVFEDPRNERVAELVYEAGLARRRGDHVEACRLYLEAADLDEELLRTIPAEHARTRAVYAETAQALRLASLRLAAGGG